MLEAQGKGWHIIGKSVKGADHIRRGLPNQDSIDWEPKSGAAVPAVLSLADGHGSDKYFRSNIGAQFAVKVANEVMFDFARGHTGQSLSLIEVDAKRLPWQIVSQWKRMVEEDWKNRKPEEKEKEEKWLNENIEARKAIASNPIIPYGATLLTVLVTERFILYFQLGDGDILTIAPAGTPSEPVPPDERNLANETTSLCNSTAVHDFRMEIQPLEGTKPALIMLSTDGYTNSYREREGFYKVGTDIWQMIHSNGEAGLKMVENNLEGWLTHTSHMGSGDDISVGFLTRMSALKEEGPGARITASPREVTHPQQGVPGSGIKQQGSDDLTIRRREEFSQPLQQQLPQSQLPPPSVKSSQPEAEISSSSMGIAAKGEKPQGLFSEPSADIGAGSTSSFAQNVDHSKEGGLPGGPLHIADQKTITQGAEPSLTMEEGILTPGSPVHIEQMETVIQGAEPSSRARDSTWPPDSPAVSPPPQVLIVSQMQREGHYYTSITQALKEAHSKAQIHVLPGHYYENILIDKEVEIIGEGPRQKIIIESVAPCIQIRTNKAVVRGLTVREDSRRAKAQPAIDIAQGHLVLRDCDISSKSGVCLQVHGAATAPLIEGCHIHGGEKGLVFTEQAGGVAINCLIDNHGLFGVEIAGGSHPTVRDCTIRDVLTAGILAWQDCQGKIEQCKIFGKQMFGIRISRGGNPTIQGCRIYKGGGCGILLDNQGHGTIKGCRIEGNAGPGIDIRQRSDPLITDCIIADGYKSGILLDEEGRGTIDDCQIMGNSGAGIEIRTRSHPVIRKCQIKEGEDKGILIIHQGAATIDDCSIIQNTHSGIFIIDNSQVSIRNCSIEGGHSYGIVFDKNSTGMVEHCSILNNEQAGVDVRQGRVFLTKGCRIAGNRYYAIMVRNKGQVTVEDCDLQGNAVRGMYYEEGSQIDRRGENKE